MLVDTLPLPSNMPVRLVCHCANGSVMFVLCNKTHEAPAAPLVTESDKVVPLTLMLEMRGVVAPETTTNNSPPVICGAANVPEATPPPLTVTDEGAVPATVPVLPEAAAEMIL